MCLQRAIVLTSAFERIGASSKLVHLGAFCLITLAVILLMAPAAYHRLVYAGEDSEEFHRLGSVVVTAATVPLALGIAADVYVVVAKILSSRPIALIFAGGVALGFVSLWHIYPLILRSRTEAARARHSEIPKGLSP